MAPGRALNKRKENTTPNVKKKQNMFPSHRATSPSGTTEVRHQTTTGGRTTSRTGVMQKSARKETNPIGGSGRHRDPESRPPTCKPECRARPTFPYLRYRCEESGMQMPLSFYCPLVARQRHVCLKQPTRHVKSTESVTSEQSGSVQPKLPSYNKNTEVCS